jgi:DnaJ homolog subfamily C member 7
MSEPTSMDIDVDYDRSNGAPLSPIQPAVHISSEAPTGNGATNGRAPTPPPHKSAPTSPAPAPAPTAEDAEAFKTAGNKFYKAKEYKRAIEEYSKGM